MDQSKTGNDDDDDGDRFRKVLPAHGRYPFIFIHCHQFCAIWVDCGRCVSTGYYTRTVRPVVDKYRFKQIHNDLHQVTTISVNSQRYVSSTGRVNIHPDSTSHQAFRHRHEGSTVLLLVLGNGDV